MKLEKIVVLCLLATAAQTLSARATIYIDDFSTPQFTPSGGDWVSGPGILGGTRYGEVLGTGINIGYAAPGQLYTYNPTSIKLSYDAGNYTPSSWLVNGLGDVDLTQGGVNSCFRIGISSAQGVPGLLTISLYNNAFFGSACTVALPASPGVLQVPFSDFQVAPAANHMINFADVGFVQVKLEFYSSESYTFDYISVDVPEPPAATLLFGCGAALFFIRNMRAVLQAPGCSDRVL